MSATKPLLPQLAAAGYKPSDITYFAMSHYHSDHTGQRQRVRRRDLDQQKAERDFMFGDKPEGIIQPAHYSALKGAKTRILEQRGPRRLRRRTVVSTRRQVTRPGTRCCSSSCRRRGPVLLAGDLYHYPEERTTARVRRSSSTPSNRKSVARQVEALLKQTGAELWIGHDMATHAKLPKAPAYVE